MNNRTTPKYKQPCKAAGCLELVGIKGAKGYCPFHYRRLSKYGDAMIILPQDYYGTWGKCSVEGCIKPVRSRFAEWCKMHYHRWYRDGDAGEVEERKRKFRAGKCAVESCEDEDTHGVWCAMHAARVYRHGDPNVFIPLEDRPYHRGEDHHMWKGNEPGYQAAHWRVRRQRGHATEHRCVDCHGQAFHWSYNHECLDELMADVSGYEVAYSPHPDQYDPRCVPCHKRFDIGRKDAAIIHG